ncbi:MAG: tetratricopeptide repeat protein [Gammaproteobacteria bacterium]
MNDQKPSHDKSFAESLAMGATSENPKMSERAAKYLDEQIAHLQREAALHDLHAENLKLQSQALRSQHKQLRSQRLHDRIRTVYQSALSLVALLVLAIIAYGFYSAATDQSVVVNQFQVPPAFAAEGNSGTVVASAFLDRLNTLQASTRSSQAARALQDAWSNNIQLQVPDVHVSLGDIRRTLHQWLGHESQINGDLVQQGNQIVLTVRGTGFAAKTFTGTPDALPTLINNAADYVFGQAEPYFYAAYLEENSQDAQAIQLLQADFPGASAREKPWILNAWGNALADLNQNAAAADKYRQAIRIDAKIWLVYGNLEDSQISLGEEEVAYQTGIAFERAIRRGHWFAAQAQPIQYTAVDYLRMDLPAVHRELLADEAAHGGQGTQLGQDAPYVAEMLARMHDNRQASFTLQTSPGVGSDHYVMAETSFVQGFMALEQENYVQAASDLKTAETMVTEYSNVWSNFLTNPACYLGLAEEFAGQPDQADAVIAQGGHFVDCYRFKGDIADHRNNWTQAQQDYQAAVALAPSLPMAYQSWGLALLRHKDYQGAIEKFRQANQRGPHWCDPLKYWGDALAAQGNYKEAIQKYAEAAKYTPGWGALELAWGQSLDKLGTHKEAMSHYQAAQSNSGSLTAVEQATLTKLLR